MSRSARAGYNIPMVTEGPGKYGGMGKDGKGRVAAVEVLLGSTAVSTMIREGKGHQVNNVIMTSRKEGMKLLDQHLKELVAEGVVDAEEAARVAEDPGAVLAAARGQGPRGTTRLAG